MKKISPWIFGAGAFLLPLGLYVKTLAPTYIPVDSAEFALCMHFWGMCHPPGFPMYVIVGKIFTSLLPFGTVIYRANLMSAVFGALTILLVYLTQVELKVKKVFALFFALILSVSSAFWEFSVSADVFTFATFWIAMVFFLSFKKRFFPAVFALGLSASHFYISAVLLPIIYWYFEGFKFKLRDFLYSSAVFILGFFPQGLMYMRMQQNPEINWAHVQGMAGFIDYMRRREFGNIFLIANPVLKFSILKFFKHIWVFLVHIFVNFGIILPLLAIVSGILGFFRDKKYSLLTVSFLVVIITQLFLLSTIDPTDSESPFQITKFYLAAFVPAVLMFGLAFQEIAKKFFEDDFLPAIFLGALLIVFLLASYKANDLSKIYFSQDLVLDSLEQLPKDAVVITVSHVFNFGSKYEQLVNGKFADKTILYFPNENNRDNESYSPEIFAGEVDRKLVEKASRGKTLGGAETYVLETISRNSNRDIYILQGDFEERFFQYLKPYIQPYGMWWKVEWDSNGIFDAKLAAKNFDNLRNSGVKFEDFHNKQLKRDTLHYAVAWHSTGVALASVGEYDSAIEFLKKSFEIRPKGDNIQREIGLIEKTQELSLKFDQLVASKDEMVIEEYGNNLFILMNYQKCIEVFDVLVGIDSKAESYNNLASCQASRGLAGSARANYEKALELNPKLEKARLGLEVLGK